MKLSGERLLKMFRQMCEIRHFEQVVDGLFARGQVHGTMHLSIGQEASAVGAISAIEDGDYILSTHRGHGHCIAKGADLKLMMAELLGKETGYCRGRGGSMHIADVEGGNLGANGIVGGGIALATGVALALKYHGSDRVVLGFFGDGANNRGIFHEALNMAAIWELPVVYVCENNQYAVSTSIKRSMPIARIADRASSYGMPGASVDGNDVIAVYETVSSMVARARRGKGPSLVECITYRWKGHSKSDPAIYRPQGELEEWKKRCPILHLRTLLAQQGIASQEELNRIDAEAEKAVANAVVYAQASPEPDPKTTMEGVYA